MTRRALFGTSIEAAELFLLCDARGAVLEASGPLAELLVEHGFGEGSTLAGLVSEVGAGPAFDFLLALRGAGAAFGHRLPLARAEPSLLVFAGLTAGRYCWLWACRKEPRLRDASHQVLSAAGELPFRPSRESCEVLRRLVTALASDWPSVAAPRVSPAGRAGEGTEAPVHGAVHDSELTGFRELLGVLHQAGLALFRDPLTGEQARLAAAVARKSEALAGLLEGGSAAAEREDPAERALDWQALLRESLALHRALAEGRQVEIELELSGSLPSGRPRAEAEINARELWLDLLWLALVEEVGAGGTVRTRVERSPADSSRVRLVAGLPDAGDLDAAGLPTGLASARAAAEEMGGTLRVHEVAGKRELVAEIPA